MILHSTARWSRGCNVTHEALNALTPQHLRNLLVFYDPSGCETDQEVQDVCFHPLIFTEFTLMELDTNTRMWLVCWWDKTNHTWLLSNKSKLVPDVVDSKHFSVKAVNHESRLLKPYLSPVSPSPAVPPEFWAEEEDEVPEGPHVTTPRGNKKKKCVFCALQGYS